MTKLYGINSDGTEVNSTKIIRETPKTYRVQDRLPWYNYRTTIPKDDTRHVALSEQEAKRLFIDKNLVEWRRLMTMASSIAENIERASLLRSKFLNGD